MARACRWRSLAALSLGACVLTSTTPALVDASTTPPDEAAVLGEIAAGTSLPPYVPGEIVIKLDSNAFPVVPVGNPSDARLAAQGSTLGTDAARAFQELIDRYELRFKEAVFLPPGLQPHYPDPVSKVQADWRQYVEMVQRRLGAVPGAEIPDLTHVYLAEVRETEETAAAAALAGDPHVAYAHPNYILYAQTTPLPAVSFIPNDWFVTQNHVNWSEGSWGQIYPDLWGLQKIQAIEAWNQFASPSTDPGLGVVVAVVDTGLDYLHGDIAGNVWVNAGEDINHNGVVDGSDLCPAVNGDFNCTDDDHDGFVDDLRGWNFVAGTNDPRDDYFHGTHVSGTVAALMNNGVGIAGVAPKARVLPVKSLNGSGTGTCVAMGNGLMYMANRGAGVNSNSWGASNVPCPEVESAIQYAYALANPPVMVVAAGNDARNAITFSPANRREVLTVAAFDENDQPTGFTNFGSKIDVAAPGGANGTDALNILSLLASGTNPGANCPTVSAGYCRTAGTSMATPHVSGVAALIRSLHPTWTSEQVRQAIRMSADDVGAPGWDIDSGYGRVNALRAVTIPAPPTANLTNISHEQSVYGVVPVTGQIGPATGMTLSRWTLSYRTMGQTAWSLIEQVSSPTPGPINAQWDVRSLPVGAYALQLEVQNSGGQVARDTRRVYRSVYQDVSGTNLPPASQTSELWQIRALRLADVDGDGNLDILWVPFDQGETQELWINDGTGHFTDQSSSRLPSSRTFGAGDALFVDVNGDGRPDIFFAVADPGANPARRLWINNGGYFTDESSTRLPPSGSPDGFGSAVAAGDIDGDGDIDLLTTYPAALLVNDGAGHFSDQTASRMPWLTSTPDSLGAVFVDLNKDGKLDFVYNLGVGINDGTGHFSQHQASFGASAAFGIAVGDVNGDGFPDILAGSTLYLNDGAGGFPSTGQNLISTPCNVVGHLADVDVDGDLDVILTTLATRAGPCRQQDLLLLNDGTGRFTDQSNMWGFVGTLVKAPLAFGDVTGDGYPDIVLPGFPTFVLPVGFVDLIPGTTLLRARWDEFPPSCVGDCNGDGFVRVNEIIKEVNIAMGNAGFPITVCRRGDANGDGQIICPEINQATNNALSGCPVGGGGLVAGAMSPTDGALAADDRLSNETGFGAALTGTVTQQIGTASGARGADVTIPVSVSGGAGTVSATQMDVLYRSDVLMNPRCSKDARLTSHSLSTSLPASPPAPAGQTRLRTLVIDTSTASTFTDGRTFTCTFTIKSTSPTGTFAITGERQHVSDHPGNELVSTVVNGWVTVL